MKLILSLGINHTDAERRYFETECAELVAEMIECGGYGLPTPPIEGGPAIFLKHAVDSGFDGVSARLAEYLGVTRANLSLWLGGNRAHHFPSSCELPMHVKPPSST
ncbi:hypothetical protein [Pararobbsia silviterrae]|uniref:hypothetical protein n=1 Tax=Pararobbsia silviterrae TaxID=1792498 RepID=UPI0011C3D4A9|nr:hypothetical protein [Pararobbsia silviterrae]